MFDTNITYQLRVSRAARTLSSVRPTRNLRYTVAAQACAQMPLPYELDDLSSLLRPYPKSLEY